MLTLRGAMPREDRARQPLCADIDGFSLHAGVRVEAPDRKRLEQLCRYITRPALSYEYVFSLPPRAVDGATPSFL
ncbi:MAG: transposase, partial [Betaproteobacteria bacterium]